MSAPCKVALFGVAAGQGTDARKKGRVLTNLNFETNLLSWMQSFSTINIYLGIKEFCQLQSLRYQINLTTSTRLFPCPQAEALQAKITSLRSADVPRDAHPTSKKSGADLCMKIKYKQNQKTSYKLLYRALYRAATQSQTNENLSASTFGITATTTHTRRTIRARGRGPYPPGVPITVDMNTVAAVVVVGLVA